MNEIAVNLADPINRLHGELLSLALSVSEAAHTAVQKAIECGRLMLQQKELLQSQTGKTRCGWLEWLEANCPQISEQTARRYMALAKRMEMSGTVEDFATIRQAYLAMGILKEPPKLSVDDAPDPEKPWVKFIKPLDAFRLWYNTRTEKSPMEEWPEDARRVLKNELRWFVNLYEQL